MKKIRDCFKILTLSAMSALLAACDFAGAPKPEIHSDGKTMGTFFSITVVGDYPGGQRRLDKDAEDVLREINEEISIFDRESMLSKFNSFRSTEPFRINHNVARVIVESLKVGSDLHGAMDITVGPLVNLWGFGPRKVQPGKVPAEDEIKAAKSRLGLDKLHIEITRDAAYIRKDNPAVFVDLSTVGEGYGADRLAELLDSKGIQNYMVAVAGAIRTKGVNGRGRDWVIAIEDPANDRNVGQDMMVPVCTRGQAISTSGSYRNYLAGPDGKFYSHIIDPATGRPVEHRTVSVTVVGPTALWTDAMDTGFMVMGAEKALTYANELNIPIYVVTRNEADDGFEAHYSREMQRYMECK